MGVSFHSSWMMERFHDTCHIVLIVKYLKELICPSTQHTLLGPRESCTHARPTSKVNNCVLFLGTFNMHHLLAPKVVPVSVISNMNKSSSLEGVCQDHTASATLAALVLCCTPQGAAEASCSGHTTDGHCWGHKEASSYT